MRGVVRIVVAGRAHAVRLISRRRPGAATNRRVPALAILLRRATDDAPCMCTPGHGEVYHHTQKKNTGARWGADGRQGFPRRESGENDKLCGV